MINRHVTLSQNLCVSLSSYNGCFIKGSFTAEMKPDLYFLFVIRCMLIPLPLTKLLAYSPLYMKRNNFL